MDFQFSQFGDLLTPTISDGDVDMNNPILTSSRLLTLDESDAYFPLTSSKEHELELATDKHSSENRDDIDQLKQDDLFSTFDFTDLNKLDRSGKL